MNSIIIIGANGSGKSKLGAWIEQKSLNEVHRVGAQRSLNFSEFIPLKSYTEAENVVFYGGHQEYNKKSKIGRWGDKEYTTKIIDDFDDTLAAIIAQQHNENQAFVEKCRSAEQSGLNRPAVPETSLDKLCRIWNVIFPQRCLTMIDSAFLAIIPGQNGTYSAREMSDGERSVLYLAAQVLCIPGGKTIIIDEPEVHLHPSLMYRLWSLLESERKDCLFIYITHDVNFAAQHEISDKVWVKSFDGSKWEWEYLPESLLPEPLLIELVGNQKPVLFVEGSRESYDYKLYSLLYPEFLIIPCGGCSQVIQNTKAYTDTPGLAKIQAYGIIDRDYRSEESLQKLVDKRIYSLKVAEVENLFLIEPLIKFLSERFGEDGQKVFDEVKDYVVNQRFKKQIEEQVNAATIAALKTELSGLDINAKKLDPQKSFENALTSISVEDVYKKKREYYKSIECGNDFNKILEVFNAKGLAHSVGHFMKVDDKEYCNKALRVLGQENHGELLEIFDGYVPTCFGHQLLC